MNAPVTPLAEGTFRMVSVRQLTDEELVYAQRPERALVDCWVTGERSAGKTLIFSCSISVGHAVQLRYAESPFEWLWWNCLQCDMVHLINREDVEWLTNDH